MYLLFVRWHISKATLSNVTKFPIQYVTCTVDWLSSDDNAVGLRYVDAIMFSHKGASWPEYYECVSSSSPGGGTECEVFRLRLRLVTLPAAGRVGGLADDTARRVSTVTFR